MSNRSWSFIFIFIVLITTIAFWIINQFIQILPVGLNNGLAIFLYVLGIVTAIKTALDAGKGLYDFYFPEKPGLSTQEKMYKEWRLSSAPIALEKVHEYTLGILGDKNDVLFWEEVRLKYTDVFEYLVSNFFVLESMVDLYKKEKKLPKNIGSLIEKILSTQWIQEKIDVKHIVGLDKFQWSLAKLAWTGSFISFYYSIASPYSTSDTEYEEIIQDMGSLFELPMWWKGLIVWFIEMGMVIYHTGKKVPFFLLLDQLRLIFQSLLMGIIDIIFPIKAILRRRGQNFLDIAVKLHIVQKDGKRLRFTHHLWENYFSAIYLLHSDKKLDRFVLQDDAPYWERRDIRREEIAIMMSGITANPRKFIKNILIINPYIAGHCLLNSEIEDISYIKVDIVRWLVENIANDNWPESPRGLLLAKLLHKLDDNPLLVIDILKTVQVKYWDVPRLNFAKVIKSFGVPAIDILIANFGKISHTRKVILLALGEIGNRRVIPFLKNLLNPNDAELYYEVNFVLWFYFDDSLARRTLQEGLLITEQAWWMLYAGGERSMQLAISSLNRAFLKKKYLDDRDFDWFVSNYKKLVSNYQEEPFAETLLSNALLDEHLQLRILAIRMLGYLNTPSSTDKLISLLEHDNGDLQFEILSAFSELKNQKTKTYLIGSLYSTNPAAVAMAIRAINRFSNFVEAVPALIEKLPSEEIYQHDGYRDQLISLLAAESLAYISDEQGREKAYEWCVAHLDDRRQIGDYQTVGDGAARLIELYFSSQDESRKKMKI